MDRVHKGLCSLAITVGLTMSSPCLLAASLDRVFDVVPASTSPINVYAFGAQKQISYTVTNKTTKPLSALSIDPEFSIDASILSADIVSNTCTGTLASNATCNFTLALKGTGREANTILSPRVCFSSGLVCSQPIAANRITIKSLESRIAANVNSILFSFSDRSASGTQGTGMSVITITNRESQDATNNITLGSLPSGVTVEENTCSGTIAANATCKITLSTIQDPNPEQSLVISADDSNTITLPVAPLKLQVLSAPVAPSPTNASLVLVNNCPIAQVLKLTNISSASVAGINLTSEASLGDVSLSKAMTYCPASLPAGKSCALQIVAPKDVSTASGGIFVKWSANKTGVIYAGVEPSGATLPTVSTPSSLVTVAGGYVVKTSSACNTVNLASFQDEYLGDGSVAWTTAPFQNQSVVNPAASTGGGANTGFGQINTINAIYQAGFGSNYAAGLCATTVHSDGGVNYVGWFLPVQNSDEFGAMISSLIGNASSDINGFHLPSVIYSLSSEYTAQNSFVNELEATRAADGLSRFESKSRVQNYIRCMKQVTY